MSKRGVVVVANNVMLECETCSRYTSVKCECCGIPYCGLECQRNGSAVHKLICRLRDSLRRGQSICEHNNIRGQCRQCCGPITPFDRQFNRKIQRIRDAFSVNNNNHEDEPECVVCMVNKPVCATNPCMNMILCIECSIKFAKGEN